jgi:hypothetical protein
MNYNHDHGLNHRYYYYNFLPPHTRAAHIMLEQYVNTVGELLMPGTTISPYTARMERVTALGYLTSPLRRTTVWEDWSPKEVALFEAALLHYGKEFSKIRRNCLPNKTTKDVVAFYYVWKKTGHYQNWKKQYEPDEGAWIMDNKKATTVASSPIATTSSGKSK